MLAEHLPRKEKSWGLGQSWGEGGGRDAQAAGRLHLHAAVVARDDTQFGEQAHANRRPAQLHCSRRALAVLDAVAARE